MTPEAWCALQGRTYINRLGPVWVNSTKFIHYTCLDQRAKLGATEPYRVSSSIHVADKKVEYFCHVQSQEAYWAWNSVELCTLKCWVADPAWLERMCMLRDWFNRKKTGLSEYTLLEITFRPYTLWLKRNRSQLHNRSAFGFHCGKSVNLEKVVDWTRPYEYHLLMLLKMVKKQSFIIF